ncbi:hypothetical protein YC2023_061298 [Brassica napus]
MAREFAYDIAREFSYDIVSLLLLVLVKMCRDRNKMRDSVLLKLALPRLNYPTVDFLMAYPWGREAYELLMDSVSNIVNKHLEKKKIDKHRFPFALHLWILDSVPILQSHFSTVIPVLDVEPSTPNFLCEKCIALKAPSLTQGREIEAISYLG